MRRTHAWSLGLTTACAIAVAGCTAGTRNDPPVPDQEELTRASDDALDLLAKSPLEGYSSEPLASGHARADDKGNEVTQQVEGRALFQIVCSGTGTITVTMPRQKVSQLVHCGDEATGIPFRGELRALVVGQRDSNGAYAWRILAKS